MGSKSTFLRVLFFVCIAAGPVIVACEATLDFDRNKIQHYKSDDGAAQPSTGDDSGSSETDDSGSTDTPDTGSGTVDSGSKDSGSDADAGN